MYLVRDVLDKQLLDRLGRKIGRVDGIVMQRSEEGSRLEVVALETGCVTQSRRVSLRLAKWVERICAKTKANSSFQIAWSGIHVDGLDVRIPHVGEETSTLRVEKRIARLLSKLPAGAPDE